MTDKTVQELLTREGEGMALLATIGQDFATSLDIDDTLHNAIAQIMDYLHAEAASIFLLDGSGKELVCRACAGPNDVTGIHLEAHQGIVGKTVQTDQAQMVRDVRNDPDFTHAVDDKTGFTTRSILCAPLSVKGKKLGAIELINKRTGEGLFDLNDQHLLRALASSASLAIHNAAMATALVEQERIQRELELAAEIQRSLLPRPPQPGFPVLGVNFPMREVSGDFYDYFSLPDGRIYFNLADVSGKGMNAALLMAKTSSLFHCLGKTIQAPGELFARVNDEVFENATRGMFVTMVGGILDPSTADVRLANAGHLPILLRSANGAYREISGEAPPLGIAPDMHFPEVHLRLGDGALYLYSDGVTEAHGAEGRPVGIEGLKALIERHADLAAEQRLPSIVEALRTAGQRLHDDVTLVVVETGT